MIDLKDIKIVVFDVDGCLTNGMYQISDNGAITKSFYTRDFYGIEQLLRNNISVIMITQSHDYIIKKQVERICCHSNLWHNSYMINKLMIMIGVDNKKEKIEEYLKEVDLEWKNVAYMGDAENDLECLELAGIAACPADAINEIEDVDYRCDAYGGEGAVYEFCKWIIREKKN